MGFSRGLRRGWLKSFERRAGELDSFRLKDGSLYFYNFDEAGAELFTYCVRAFALEEEDIPEPAGDVVHVTFSGQASSQPPRRGHNLTDLGNAERFVARHGEGVRYCYPWRK